MGGERIRLMLSCSDGGDFVRNPTIKLMEYLPQYYKVLYQSASLRNLSRFGKEKILLVNKVCLEGAANSQKSKDWLNLY
jgi:hypothetical protein